MACAIGLRPRTGDDLPFLRALHAGSRLAEIAWLPWSIVNKRGFLDQQFCAQSQHFDRFYPAADFLIVQSGAPAAAIRNVGRLYLDRGVDPWRLIDILLLPDAQRGGIGTALIGWAQAAARAARATGIDLHVLHENRQAYRLYRRLGFCDAESAAPTHRRMVWTVS